MIGNNTAHPTSQATVPVWGGTGRKCDSLDSRGFHILLLRLQKQESIASAKQVVNARLELLNRSMVSRSSTLPPGEIFAIRINRCSRARSIRWFADYQRPCTRKATRKATGSDFACRRAMPGNRAKSRFGAFIRASLALGRPARLRADVPEAGSLCFPTHLTLSGVAVEKVPLGRKRSKFAGYKMARDPRRSVITHPDAILFW
jgi:hypothetical protein